MKVIVRPYKDIKEMWATVLDDARTTIGKDEKGQYPSEKFKKDILMSKHSPIRGLIFEVYMEDVPYHITQQFSRHHIALDSNPNMQFSEDIISTDMEHFAQTSRECRTGKPRNERRQDDPVRYKFRANAQGLMDASKKRLCYEADKGAVKLWRLVKTGISDICPELADRMQAECVCVGFCPEVSSLISCKYTELESYDIMRRSYIKK